MNRRSVLGDERGANLVEFALVLPVLVLVLFGIVDLGTAYDRALSLRSGVQQGARAGVVANFGPDPSTCSLTPPPPGGPASTAARLACLTKAKVGLREERTRVGFSFVDANGSGTAAYEVGDYVRICVEFPLESASGVLSQFMNGRQRATAEMRIEQVTVPALAAYTESDVAAC